jgi:hypothetical protein
MKNVMMNILKTVIIASFVKNVIIRKMRGRENEN